MYELHYMDASNAIEYFRSYEEAMDRAYELWIQSKAKTRLQRALRAV